MKQIIKEEFLNKSVGTLSNILDSFDNLPVLKMEELMGNSALIIVDMNNGFCEEGALYSPRIREIRGKVSRIAHGFAKNDDVPVLMVNENHPEDAIEFNSYPPHCVKGSREAEIIDELKDISNKVVIGKNSTNAFVVEEFKNKILELYAKGIRKFVFIGNCTDLCLFHPILSMQTYFTHHNMPVEIIVPMSTVETFDLDITNHDGDLMNVVFLYSMLSNGVNVVKTIE